MKKIAVFAFIFVCFIAVLISGFFIYNNQLIKILYSPLPDFLTSFKNQQVSTINLWLPSLGNPIKTTIARPVTTARSVLLYDLTDGQVLFASNPKEKLPIASLTKIMTAIIALENKKKDDRYLVGKKDLVGEDSMGLDENEVLSQKELLYGLILHSGNDAAETLANNFQGGRDAFIRAMNDKARSLGLSDTHFTNPTGLEGDGKQYSTTYDLLVVTRYAILNFPLFNEVVSTFDYAIPQTSTHKSFYLENETNLLTSYPGVKGVKTGYTPEAGLCLVTYLDFGGHKIIGIILGSDNRREEMKELLDYSLKSLRVKPPAHG
ncbi:MAG: D-alanyl-D-alanine carboxypeptidase [Patescibacteria group bacterium]|nr:D-alanyl-D-alanine carboxypeptidase [Patescibacteria group bacterium]